MKVRFSSILTSLAVIAVCAVALLYGAERLRVGAEREIYRERIRDIAGRYGQLRDLYNQAVAKTAITELLVGDGQVTVRVRTADGVVMEVPTQADPSREVYVDYAVVDGRVWIRRVFDETTPPAEATLVDPKLANIDWDLAGAELGKAIYRTLGDGRWVVSVTGNGSLGLVRADGDEPIELEPPPEMVEYEAVTEEIDEEVEQVSWGDLWHRLMVGN